MAEIVTISATDLKRNTSDVLDRIVAGDDIVIERHGAPIARLTQPDKPTESVWGAWNGVVDQACDDDELLEAVMDEM